MSGVILHRSSLFVFLGNFGDSNECERSEDDPWPPGDVGGLVDAH